MTENIDKLTELDRYYDRESINNWSIREYSYRGDFGQMKFTIERCTDVSPRYFNAHVHVGHPKQTGRIKIGGNYDFGDGVSWTKIIPVVVAEIAKMDKRIKVW